MSTEDALRVSSVYIAMVKAAFSVNNPFTIAENVPIELVSYIKEQSRFFKGIEVRVDTGRAYHDGTIAPHIIGFYDSISAEEYDAVTEKYREAIKAEGLTEEELKVMKLRAYGMTDKIGKFGIEGRGNAVEGFADDFVCFRDGDDVVHFDSSLRCLILVLYRN